MVISPLMPVHATQAANFIQSFLTQPTGTSPEEIKLKILHWVGVANSPQDYVKDADNRYEVAAKRKTARQNVQRLAARHPNVVAQITREQAQ